ncbi:MAG: DUF4422 domain-containing protein [Lachnospiraceae bacterium]|nr:DUF4422 domain-containing protein [Lachnospiraceae bacterium]
MKTKIIIAMHKSYTVPEEDVYLPMHVGAEGKETIEAHYGDVARGENQADASEKQAQDEARKNEMAQVSRDDTGENISHKNPYYCELTGLYWAWKNLDADAIGLVHYRRYFKGSGKNIMTTAEAEEIMANCDIAVPTKRKYYIESLYSHYAHTLDGDHLDKAKLIIAQRHNDYLDACEEVYNRSWGYMFNMCIMRREYLEEYCQWLFDILGELENDIGVLEDAFSARLYGRVSEILFNVWLVHKQQENPDLRVSEVPTMHLEKVNWIKKGGAFLVAKFFGKKYKKSF